jgi:polysaccharide export outer membrane protein
MTKPSVAVTVTEFRSQPISVIGAVNNPGVHQVRGHKTLVEVLSLCGGLRPDAGNLVKITRRKESGPIPVPSAKVDASGQFTVAELSLKSIMQAERPQDNLVIKPDDVITIPRAEMVYVIGEVRNSGGYVLNDRESISVLKALSLAGGIVHTAAPKRAKILCSAAGGSEHRVEVAIDLKKVLDGSAPDPPLHPEDILFIPTNTPKSVALRAIETAIQTGSGVVIWRSAHY